MGEQLGSQKGLGESNSFTNQSDKVATDFHMWVGHPVDGVSVVDGQLSKIKRRGKVFEFAGGEVKSGETIRVRVDHRDLGKTGRDLFGWFTRRGLSVGEIMDYL